MTNAELIKALRYCVVHPFRPCNGCILFETDGCINVLHGAAADALEAADKRIARLEEDLKTREAEREVMQDTIKVCEKRIEELEAQLPKEGEWKKILLNGDGTSDYQCSACLGIITDVPDDDEHPLCSFCPNCGARMDGKEQTDETN